LQGTRKNFTALDFAGLEDIGWQCQASTVTTITGFTPRVG